MMMMTIMMVAFNHTISEKNDFSSSAQPLTQPRRCEQCTQRTIREAYHIICYKCSEERGVCAKCRQPADVMPEDENTVLETTTGNAEDGEQLIDLGQIGQDKLEQVQTLLASMSLAKKKTFLRRLNNGETIGVCVCYVCCAECDWNLDCCGLTK